MEGGGIKLLNEDCIEGMKQFSDNYFDIAIADPPYGLGKRLSDGGGKLKSTPMASLYREKDWDVLPSEEYWRELFRVSKNQVIFGANYFMEYLPSSRGFICWDKKNEMPTMSACELVWTSYDKPAKVYRKNSMDLDRFHPTQKPIDLYTYCLQFVKAEKHFKILDPNLGSGSSAIACHKYGISDFVGFEIDSSYHSDAVKRFNLVTSQTQLF